MLPSIILSIDISSKYIDKYFNLKVSPKLSNGANVFIHTNVSCTIALSQFEFLHCKCTPFHDSTLLHIGQFLITLGIVGSITDFIYGITSPERVNSTMAPGPISLSRIYCALCPAAYSTVAPDS